MNSEHCQSGKKSSEMSFQNDQLDSLEGIVRESYARVVYSHKVHEKEADILYKKDNLLKILQIVLSAIATGTILSILVQNEKIFTVLAAILSTSLLVVNSYAKSANLSVRANEHSKIAVELWVIRESYLSLLGDIKFIEISDIIKRRDTLQDKLSEVYKVSPRTSNKAYRIAQDSLKNMEELTFSNEEINKFLPENIRK